MSLINCDIIEKYYRKIRISIVIESEERRIIFFLKMKQKINEEKKI